MRMARWVAAIALLFALTGVKLNNAHAQEPTVSPNCAPGVKCVLTDTHYIRLQAQIEANKAELRRLRGQLAEARKRGADTEARGIEFLIAQYERKTRQLQSRLSSWAGFNFRVGLFTQGSLMTGSDRPVVPLQLDVSLEWVDPETHLGIRGGLALGVWFTEEKVDEKVETLAPFMGTGYLAAVAAWENWTVVLPMVRMSFLQAPFEDTPGYLWVTVNGGGEYHINKVLAIDLLLGTTAYSQLVRNGGFHVLGVFQWYWELPWQ